MACGANSMCDVADKISVLNVCETATGGPATYFVLLNQSTKAMARHTFLIPESQRHMVPNLLRIELYKDGGCRGVRRVLRLVRGALRLARLEKPSVVFFHSTWSLPVLVAFRLASTQCGLIYCAHGWAAERYDSGSLKRWLVASIEGALSGLAHAVINISEYDQNYALQAKYRGNHRLVENAVPDVSGKSLSPPFDGDASTLNMLFVGRFDRQKGIDILLRAFREARRDRPDLVLHMVGATVLGDASVESELNTVPGLKNHGWQGQEALESFFAYSDVVVVPSRWEGFGLVVAEAFRAGTPVIVSDRGALPGLVDRDVTGFVVPLDVEAFAEMLRRLDKAVLKRMRGDCRKCFESRFAASRFGSEMSRVIREVSSS